MSDGLKLADTYIHSVQSFPYTPLEEKFHKSPIRRKSEIFLKKISQKTGGGIKMAAMCSTASFLPVAIERFMRRKRQLLIIGRRTENVPQFACSVCRRKDAMSSASLAGTLDGIAYSAMLGMPLPGCIRWFRSS